MLFGTLIILSVNSCKQNTSSEESSEATTENVEPKVENKVMHDGDNVKEGRVVNMHGTRYIELFFAYKGSGNEGILAECFNTMFTTKGIPESRNTAPQDLVEGLDLKKMAEEYGVANVSLNGPKIWLPDWTDIEEGKERTFNGIEARWVARLHMGDNAKGVNASKPYETTVIKRNSSLGWNKGTKVLLLDDPEGNTYIMKGFELGLNPKYTYSEFLEKAESLYKNLPEGWKIRVKTLDKDLIETPENGLATIMPDEFFNVFDKTGPGMMNYKP
jgi:hypothetical protein